MPELNNHPASFRDSSGYVFLQENTVYRLIQPSYQQDYECLMSSGLFQKLVADKLLVAHEEVENTHPNGYKVIRPIQVPIISYPYEWSFSQLQDAALLTLKIQKAALEHGMILKDASAFNIQFIGSKPIFIDTLSFQKLQKGEPWIAYRQFCQHFLAPLALMSYTSTPINKLLVTYLDGIPLSAAASILPNRAMLNIGLLLHLYLHKKAEQSQTNRKKQLTSAKRLSKNSTLHLIDHLETTISKLKWKHHKSTWGDYYNYTNYSSSALQHKATIVKTFLSKISGDLILDIGGNNAYFSTIAKLFAPHVVVVDSDSMAVEKGYLKGKEEQQDGILPLVMDITNPSPAVGWNNVERSAFFDRVRPSTILALAIIHHLVITNNVTLPMLAAYFSANCKYLIIEFIPTSDSQVEEMLQGRNLTHFKYSQLEFEAAFSYKFTVIDQAVVEGSNRILYLMESKA